MNVKKRLSILLTVLLTVLAGLLICRSDGRAQSSVLLSKGQTVYIPIYSHVYSGDRELPFYVAATLSIRNTDPNNALEIGSVDYYDSEGKLVKKYLEKPMTLNPLATVRYVIKESDKVGGSGANFIVRWKSDNPVNPPLMESIMIGTMLQQGISFTSRGQVIEE